MSTNASKKTSVNLVLKGKITNISRNTRLTDKELDASISESSKMILKQVITNLQTSAV